MASSGPRWPALGDGPLAPVACGWDADSDHHNRPDGTTMCQGASGYHHERGDWPGDARPEDLASWPRYDLRERNGHRGYANKEGNREWYTPRTRHEYGHAESHWHEPTQGRRRGGDCEHLPDDFWSRRGEG